MTEGIFEPGGVAGVPLAFQVEQPALGILLGEDDTEAEPRPAAETRR